MALTRGAIGLSAVCGVGKFPDHTYLLFFFIFFFGGGGGGVRGTCLINSGKENSLNSFLFLKNMSFYVTPKLR